MSDNATPFYADEYEKQIQRMMPFYENFHQSTLDIVRTVKPKPKRWLDTGCGTGNFAMKAAAAFPDTEFFLADPSGKMLDILKQNPSIRGRIEQKSSELLEFPDDYFEVITAILSHHYSERDSRRAATLNCYRMLKTGGVYVTFENIHPFSSDGVGIAMRRWMNFKFSQGESPENEAIHFSRFGKEYLPITILEHIELLRSCGFRVVELLWASYMQAGFFAIK